MLVPGLIMARVASLNGSSSRNNTERGVSDQSGKPCTSAVYEGSRQRAGKEVRAKENSATALDRAGICPTPLQFRQYDSFLCLVFSFTVGIAGLADFVRLEEDDLTETFVGVDTGG